MTDDEVSHHLHIASLHCRMTWSKSKDVCEVMDHAVSQGIENTNAALSAQRAAFVELIKQRFPHSSLVETMLEAVDKKMDMFHTSIGKQQKINEPTTCTRIQSSCMDGPNSILKNLPIPEADTLLGCMHIPANQIVNHLLAIHSDVLVLWDGFDEDWLDAAGRCRCEFFQDRRERLKMMMINDPKNVTRHTRVVFIRAWSDGFEAHQIKAKNKFNNLQLFAPTLRALRGKIARWHTMPFALCFKKESHSEISIQLLMEVHELETPRKRCFVSKRCFHTTITFVDMINQDCPKWCASTCIAQLGSFAHRWGFTCQCKERWMPSCSTCELKRIKRLIAVSSDASTGRAHRDAEKCKDCMD